MIAKRLLKPAVWATIVVICAPALTWGSKAAIGQGDRPEGTVLGGQAEEPTVAAPVPGGPGFYAQGAFGFHPYYQTDQWAFNVAALYNPGTGWATYSSALPLPHGATVTKFVVYYYDNDGDPGDFVYIYLMQCPFDSQVCNTMAQAQSSGADPGNRFAEDSTISYRVIDNQSNSYTAELHLPPSLDVRLIGIRVDYAYALALPLVLKGH